MTSSTPDQFPLVSVGLPTFNRAKSVDRAINSILSQTYPHLEFLISDNASTDETEAIIRTYMENEPRICYFRQRENMGLTRNFEFVLQKARGKYFIWISDDDELVPEAIEKYVDFLEKHPEHSLVSGVIDYWDNGKLKQRESGLNFEDSIPIFRTLGYYAKVSMGAMVYGLMRRESAQKLRLHSVIGTDWHFVAGLAFLGKIKNLDFVAYNKKKGGVSRSSHHHASGLGEKKIWGYFPFTKIALDAIAEISGRNPSYRKLGPVPRILAAFTAGALVLGHYSFQILPRIWAGKVLRTFNIKTPRERRLWKAKPRLQRSVEMNADYGNSDHPIVVLFFLKKWGLTI